MRVVAFSYSYSSKCRCYLYATLLVFCVWSAVRSSRATPHHTTPRHSDTAAKRFRVGFSEIFGFLARTLTVSSPPPRPPLSLSLSLLQHHPVSDGISAHFRQDARPTRARSHRRACVRCQCPRVSIGGTRPVFPAQRPRYLHVLVCRRAWGVNTRPPDRRGKLFVLMRREGRGGETGREGRGRQG